MRVAVVNVALVYVVKTTAAHGARLGTPDLHLDKGPRVVLQTLLKYQSLDFYGHRL